MSCGSRATQAKPEALPSCSESSYSRLSGDVSVSAREDFLTVIFFVHVRNRVRHRWDAAGTRCAGGINDGARQNPQVTMRASFNATGWKCELMRA
jgi:hypothetical protein